MREHHQAAVRNLVQDWEPKPGIIAAILGGSVAKGLERPDSDIDAMLVLTDQLFREYQESGRLAFTLPMERDPYEGGYYDLKVMTKDELILTGQNGSEPARNAFVKARVLFSRDPEDKVRERIKVCFAGLLLSRGYFWDCAAKEDNRYLRMKSACDAVLFGVRMLYAHNRVFFPCHRTFLYPKYMDLLREKPAGIIGLAQQLLDRMDDASMTAFTDAVLGFRDWGVTGGEGYSAYIEYFEKFWLYGHPNTYEM